MLRLPAAAPNDFSHVSNPSAGDFIHWSDEYGTAKLAGADQRIAYEEFGRARMARVSHSYPHKRNYAGEYWFAGTGRLVWFESLLEQSALLRLDYLHTIEQVSSQPFCFVYHDGSRAFPDYYALHADGRRVVYEVKPTSKMTVEVEERFRRTAETCYQIGWEFYVINELPRVALHNLEWIARFRHPRYAPGRRTRLDLLRSLETPLSFMEAAWLLDRRDPARRIHELYHLMWTRDIRFDGFTPMHSASTLWRNDASSPNEPSVTLTGDLAALSSRSIYRPDRANTQGDRT